MSAKFYNKLTKRRFYASIGSDETDIKSLSMLLLNVVIEKGYAVLKLTEVVVRDAVGDAGHWHQVSTEPPDVNEYDERGHQDGLVVEFVDQGVPIVSPELLRILLDRIECVTGKNILNK